MKFGGKRRCYLRMNVTMDGQPFMERPNCVLADQYASFSSGGSLQSELSNSHHKTPLLSDYNDWGSLAGPQACTGACCDEYMTGTLEKPWDHFGSCEEQKRMIGCEDIKIGCARTCGVCIAPCEDQGGCCNHFNTGGMKKPWNEFQSCDNEIALDSNVCFNKDTLAIRDGCRLACGLCAPTGFVESNEYSSAVTGSHVNSIVGGEFSRL